MAPQIFAGGRSDAVGQTDRIELGAEIVADVGIAPLVVEITHYVTRTGILRRGIEIDHGIERITGTGLDIEGVRPVELPIGDRRRPDGARGERRADGERLDGVVYVGVHPHRVGHVGTHRELGGALQTGDIGLCHLDLLADLRRGPERQQRDEDAEKEESFHGHFSFWMRAFASSTMPSSEGE